MNAIHIELPASLHKEVCRLAEKEHTSVNQIITMALAEKISALTTQDYLEKRARQGSRAKFENAMDKVADIEPEESDRIH